MSEIDEKRAKADLLRSELSALRTRKQSGIEAVHNASHSVQLDGEIVDLERQLAEERASIATNGSVGDAIAAMEAADSLIASKNSDGSDSGNLTDLSSSLG